MIYTFFKKKLPKVAFAILITVFIYSCKDDGLLPVDNVVSFHSKLSAYNIYQPPLAQLTPSPTYVPYELASGSFADYAEKQRLIYLPTGTNLEVVQDGLPKFPDGTILVKTFYYYQDKRTPSQGKKIIETRLLIKTAGHWDVATYLWDEEQQDAHLVQSGFNKTVNFINEQGLPQVIAYRLPSNRACASCHNVNKGLSPIGTKLRNMNIVLPNTGENQLHYFQREGLLSSFDISTIEAMPNYHNTHIPLEKRARAYLDINCAHCHDAKGSSADLNMFYAYNFSLEDSKILEHKEEILKNMQEGSMPQIGTSVLDEEGIRLIKDYINSL